MCWTRKTFLHADLSVYSQADLNKVALRLNQRPRQTLGFQTPASKLQASVASTGGDRPVFEDVQIYAWDIG
jgi:IS30 family transposase